ncbi:unnamed protein product [Vicia faba]|uniref:Mediator of RNA polymerase II transcription subunit 1 n=1 Tax=Vicia faba TaxID=3906 RepID=A0AAV0ZI22_VICFA|nr:unnamed protein product [Vicia faba]
MEKSEPALVPQWLRSNGSVTSSAHHFASSSNHTDTHTVAHHSRNRNSKTTSDFDSPRSVFLERTFSSNSRRGTINGSAKNAYSSFNRNHRDKDRDRDRDKDRSNFLDHWDRKCSEPLADLFSVRTERDPLRRSHSLVSRKQNELANHRGTVNTKSGGNCNQSNGNDALSGGSISSSFHKAVFDKDFPSLGGDERPGSAEIGRVASPGLGGTASQSLPVGSSSMIGGEGWTSALVEAPSMMGSSSTGSLTAQQTGAPISGSLLSSTSAGLNMAEALVQTPYRAQSTPQVSVKAQRLEELALKQSRQLIPVTPPMPKALVNNSEKSKPKTALRNPEMNMVAKSVPQQPSALHIVNHSVRNGNAKGDPPKTSGKFTDLKSVVWENGVSATAKEASTPTNYSNSKPGNNLAVASAVASAPLRNPTERRPTSLDLKVGSTTDKKQVTSQVQSRHDFFNLIKRKTLNSSVLPDSSPAVSPATADKFGEVNMEAVEPPAILQNLGNSTEVTSNGNAHAEEVQRLPDIRWKDSTSDEEEVAFLRSLGWEEDDSGVDEGLTEEEINAFYQECLKLGTTTLKLCPGMQPKLSKFFESYATNMNGASAGSSSSDSGSEV